MNYIEELDRVTNFEKKDLVKVEEYLKGKNAELYHANDKKFEDPIDSDWLVDTVLQCVYCVSDNPEAELLHFGDIGEEVVFGPKKER